MSKYNIEKFDKFNEISSISEQDLDDIDSQREINDDQDLQLKQFYQTKNTSQMCIYQRDSVNFSVELIKKLIKSAITVSYNNYIERMIPTHSIQYVETALERMVVLDQCINDDCINDYQNAGLEEDKEPVSSKIETWIRSKINVDKQNQENLDDISSLPANRKNSPDTKSKTSVGYKTFSIKSRSKQKADEKQQPPQPIDLTEPIYLTPEEEQVRLNKENQIKQAELQRQKELKQRQEGLKEEQQKMQKIQKENKNCGFTYDYNGEVIPIIKNKTKLPPQAYQINYQLEQIITNSQDKKFKKKRTANNSATKPNPNPNQNPNTNNININNSNNNNNIQDNNNPNVDQVNQTSQQQQQSQQLSRQKSLDKDPMSQLQIQQVQVQLSQQYSQSSAPLFEHLELAEGVTITFEGKRRIGPRPATVDMEMLSNTTGGGKIRMHKKQFDELIKDKGVQRTGSRGGLDSQQKSQRFLKTAGNPQSQSIDEEQMSGLDAFNYKTFGKKGMTQKFGGTDGQIKINQVKLVQSITNTISEEDEILMKKQIELEKTKKEELLRKINEQKKTPNDEFNFQITVNRDWGKGFIAQGQTLSSYMFGQYKQSDREQQMTLGSRSKPRQRLQKMMMMMASQSQKQIINIPAELPVIKDKEQLRNKTSQGFRKQIVTQNQTRKIGTAFGSDRPKIQNSQL